jgi:hypothetical protein
MKSQLLFLFVCLGLLGQKGFGAEPSQFFVAFFSYNGNPDKPSLSHTFAVFLKLGSAENAAKEMQSISWMPEGGKVRPLALQKGHCFSFTETLRIAGNRPVASWGPFRIEETLYERATQRIQFLNSGRVDYKMFDWRSRKPAFVGESGGAINCLHAVSDLVGDLDAGEKSWGNSATEKLVRYFKAQGVLLDGGKVYPEILARIKDTTEPGSYTHPDANPR